MELFLLALRNLAKRKRRAALTMLGIFIGISAVVALVALGQGLQQTINAQFEKVGADKIVVQAKEIGFGDEKAPGKLGKRELSVIKKVNGVMQVAGHLMHAVQVEFNEVQRTLYVMSVPDRQKEVELMNSFGTWEPEKGRLLTHKDREKVVVGYNLANRNLFKKNIFAGNKIRINGELFEVIGTLKRIGDPVSDSAIIIPEEDGRRVINNSEAPYAMIIAKVGAGESPEIVAERTEKELRQDRHQKEGKEDFTVQTSTDLIESFNKVLSIIQVVFAGIAAISLVVAGIGIMNTMYTAVLERTQEIGVMKAIGAKNSDVLLLFLTESALIGLAGGIAGVLIGIGISKGVEFFVNTAFGAGTITAVYPVYLIAGSLLFSAFIGTISGVLPARRAAKLKPVDALRYE